MAIQYKPGKEPHPREHRMIFRNVDRVDWNPSMDRYLAEGGYEQLKKAVTMEPKAITEEIGLGEAAAKAAQILQGTVRGRLVVDVNR